MTAAASRICSTVVPSMATPSRVSSAQPSCPMFITITCIPRFMPAFCVLSRVRRLGLRKIRPRVLCCPSFSNWNGFAFILRASSRMARRSTTSFTEKNFFITLYFSRRIQATDRPLSDFLNIPGSDRPPRSEPRPQAGVKENKTEGFMLSEFFELERVCFHIAGFFQDGPKVNDIVYGKEFFHNTLFFKADSGNG